MPVSKAKAHRILKHGSIRGKPLTAKQKRYFGLIASGKEPSRVARHHHVRVTKKRKRRRMSRGKKKKGAKKRPK